MPTYSYRCSACNHTFDKVQRITEDAIKVCEACGAEAASRYWFKHTSQTLSPAEAVRLACALPGTATRLGAGPDFCRPRS